MAPIREPGLADDEEPLPVEEPPCCSAFVVRKSNPLRSCWMCLVTLLLVYTGTIFLYRLCFLDFRIPPPSSDPTAEASSAGWKEFDLLVTIIFWVDLVANFFFSFDDEQGDEVVDLRAVSTHYLQSYFAVNFIACIPEELIEVVISGTTGSGEVSSSLNQGVRTVRLQRISRLARLMRLTRLGKLKAQRTSHWYRWMQRQKGVRVLNLAGGLTWVVHVLACGWYLCASLHDDPSKSWVARRVVDVDPSGNSVALIEAGPLDQWLTSMYFILTVFTTVGFGDMYAVTMGEIVYVCFTMAVGAVVHSIVISEVINVVTSVDQMNLFVSKQRELVEAFAAHTQLDATIEDSLKHWIDGSAKQWFSTRYDREAMKELIVGDSMPRELLGQLPERLFTGKLIQNRFLRICDGMCVLPPRLPMLTALALHRSHFFEGEAVYQAQDYPFSMFLVFSGTFAFVAKPSREGGVLEAPKPPISAKVAEPAHGGAMVRLDEVLRVVRGGPLQGGGLTPHSRGPMVEDDSQPSVSDALKALRPYELFSSGSYFGECELVPRTLPRRATARCESESGEVLTLNKADFKRLAEQFPQFGAKWAELAARRERRRMVKLAEFTRGGCYKQLAARIIQKWCRKVCHRRGGGGPQKAGVSRSTGGEGAHRLSSFGAIDACHDRQDRIEQHLEKLSKNMCMLIQQVDAIVDSTANRHAETRL